MEREIKNKKVVFITTKNLDYIRNTQEIDIIRKLSSSYYITIGKLIILYHFQHSFKI